MRLKLSVEVTAVASRLIDLVELPGTLDKDTVSRASFLELLGVEGSGVGGNAGALIIRIGFLGAPL